MESMFFHFGSCNSMRTSTISDALISLGATWVEGWSNSVNFNNDFLHMWGMLTCLAYGYTAGESVDYILSSEDAQKYAQSDCQFITVGNDAYQITTPADENNIDDNAENYIWRLTAILEKETGVDNVKLFEYDDYGNLTSFVYGHEYSHLYYVCDETGTTYGLIDFEDPDWYSQAEKVDLSTRDIDYYLESGVAYQRSWADMPTLYLDVEYTLDIDEDARSVTLECVFGPEREWSEYGFGLRASETIVYYYDSDYNITAVDVTDDYGDFIYMDYTSWEYSEDKSTVTVYSDHSYIAIDGSGDSYTYEPVVYTIAYDENGNIESATGESESGNTVTYTFTYDENGNVESITGVDSTYTFRWEKYLSDSDDADVEEPPEAVSNLVTTAYTASFDDLDYTREITGDYTYEYYIPQINLESEAIDDINDEIWNLLFKGFMQEVEDCVAGNTSIYITQIDYEWFVNGNILSLVICVMWDWGGNDYYVYNIDINSARVASDDEVYSYCELTQDQYRELVYEALYNYYCERYKDASEIDGYDEKLLLTISDENIDLSVPFLNEEGQLCIIGRIYALAGAEYYDHIIVLDESDINEKYSSVSSNVMTEDEFQSFLSDEIILYYLYTDYDEDGLNEVFVITGSADDYLTGYYINVNIYFQSSDGEITELQSDTYGYLRGENYLDTGNGKFLVWEVSAGGSGSSSLIYGVKNGQIYEPALSGSVMNFDFVYESTNTYCGITSDWSNGYHDYTEHVFLYNSDTGEFEETS
ncbi:MAG: hypothetical protein LUG57_09785 [Oscillospiraceae bacterium]|nr:hypothetical protein [Oscillospiraceae bacterium]